MEYNYCTLTSRQHIYVSVEVRLMQQELPERIRSGLGQLCENREELLGHRSVWAHTISRTCHHTERRFC